MVCSLHFYRHIYLYIQNKQLCLDLYLSALDVRIADYYADLWTLNDSLFKMIIYCWIMFYLIKRFFLFLFFFKLRF